jgi:mono/diheme cytochrome c family protein
MRFTRRLALIPLAVATLALAASLALAAEPAAETPKPLDGKELFKTQCKICHGAKAKAGEYTPVTLIQEQWEEFFAGTYAEVHAAVPAPEAADKPAMADKPAVAERKVTDLIDAASLEAIRKFCVDHAADSEQPMTCG